MQEDWQGAEKPGYELRTLIPCRLSFW